MKKPRQARFFASRPAVLKSAALGAVFAAVSAAAPYVLPSLPASGAPPAASADAHPPAAPLHKSLPPSPKDGAARTFGFQGTEFVLDGRPFQILAGELHFQRIPREYWKDRLLKARALGLNTIGTYVFWNALEPEPGQWDFSGRNDLAAFIAEAREAGLWVLVRPGPYTCAEWDFGGLPAWLLRAPDIKVRCSDPRFLAACGKYIEKIAGILRPLQVHEGGSVLMVQIENEYGSYGNDRGYLSALKDLWEKNGLRVPFSTADGAAPHMLEAGTIPGCAIGLDPAASREEFAEAEKLGRNVPVFCSELYPGWLTHWGEPWARTPAEDILKDLRWLLENRKSFSLYVLHGGTNFGFWAGANMGKAYQPDVTSYDYDAPSTSAAIRRRNISPSGTCSLNSVRPERRPRRIFPNRSRRSTRRTSRSPDGPLFSTICLPPSPAPSPGRWKHSAKTPASSSTGRSSPGGGPGRSRSRSFTTTPSSPSMEKGWEPSTAAAGKTR